MPRLQSIDTLDILYRPNKFGDIIGQKAVVSILKGMLKSGKVDRTLMLFGPSGSGKTTLARMFARYVNCTGDKFLCSKCETCLCNDITEHPDVHEFNMASATGKDDVESIVRQATYMPQTNFRVFILDELHQCFPEYVNIMIDYDKSVSIKEIYENPSITHVLSYDLNTGKIEKKKIMRKIKNKFKGKLNKLYTSNLSYLPSTPNHNIYNKHKQKIKASSISVGDSLIKYDGNFERYKKCSYCEGLVSYKSYLNHIKTKHSELLISNHNHSICKICSNDFFSEKELKKHILKKHIPKEFYNRVALDNIKIDMDIDGLNNFIFFLRTGKRKCPYCDYVSVTIQSHIFWKHGDKKCTNTVREKHSKAAYARYETEEGKKFINNLSKIRRGKNNPIFRYINKKQIFIKYSNIFKNWWKRMPKSERAWRIKIFQNAPVHSGQNKVEKIIEAMKISNLIYTGDGSYYVTLNKDCCFLDCKKPVSPNKCKKNIVHKNPDFIYCPKACGTCKFFNKCEFDKYTKACNKYIKSPTFRTSKVVEVMDFEYWHCKKEVSILKKAYAKFDIDCLFIDSKDVYSDIDEVRSRIECFINNSNDLKVTRLALSKEKDIDIYNLEIEQNHNYFAIAGNYGYYKTDWRLLNGKDLNPILVANCSAAAKESLLKPLENPPSKCIWILCTTEPDKFKQTILNRCTKLEIKDVHPKELFVRLKKVAELEKSPIYKEDDILMRIADLVNGEPRSGLKALGKVIHYMRGSGKVDIKIVRSMVSEIVDLDYFTRIKEYLLSIYMGNLKLALTKLHAINNSENFLKSAIEYHNNALFDQISPSLVDGRFFYTQWVKQKRNMKISLPNGLMARLGVEMVKTLSEIKNYSVQSNTLTIALTCKLVAVVKRSMKKARFSTKSIN